MSTAEQDQRAAIIARLGPGSGAPGQRLRRWLWGGALLAVILTAALLTSGGQDNQVRYLTQPVQRGNLLVAVSATGTLQPTTQVQVGIEVSGTIKTVAVDYNDRVTTGQVLVRLDTSKLQAQVLQSSSALESAKARVLQVEATIRENRSQLERLEQVRELSGGKVPSRQELDAARASLARARADAASARAAVAQAQAALHANQTDLAKAEVRSPIDGVVLTRTVDPGQTVAAAFQTPVLFTLAKDLARMQLQVDVDEADVGQVRAGQTATFTVDAYPDRTFPAHVIQVRYGAQTVAGVVTYKTVLEVDNAELLLLPGMTATASIAVKRLENVLLAPNAALRFVPPQVQADAPAPGGGLLGRLMMRRRASPPTPATEERKGAGQRVFILRDGQAVAIPITTGASDGILTEVKSTGLAPGAALVVDALAAES